MTDEKAAERNRRLIALAEKPDFENPRWDDFDAGEITVEQVVMVAEVAFALAENRIRPFSRETSVETLLLTSIAASNLAIAKSRGKR